VSICSYFYVIVCSSVGQLPPTENPTAVSNYVSDDDDDDDDDNNNNNNNNKTFPYERSQSFFL
jgi:hypothetical protein